MISDNKNKIEKGDHKYWGEMSFKRIAYEIVTEKVSLEQSSKGSKRVSKVLLYLWKNIPGRRIKTSSELQEWLTYLGSKESSRHRVDKGRISRRGNRSVFMWVIVKMLSLTLRWRDIGGFRREKWYDLIYILTRWHLLLC